MGSAAFKAVGKGEPLPAGSIPVHLRHKGPCQGMFSRWRGHAVVTEFRESPVRCCDGASRDGALNQVSGVSMTVAFARLSSSGHNLLRGLDQVVDRRGERREFVHALWAPPRAAGGQDSRPPYLRTVSTILRHDEGDTEVGARSSEHDARMFRACFPRSVECALRSTRRTDRARPHPLLLGLNWYASRSTQANTARRYRRRQMSPHQLMSGSDVTAAAGHVQVIGARRGTRRQQ